MNVGKIVYAPGYGTLLADARARQAGVNLDGSPRRETAPAANDNAPIYATGPLPPASAYLRGPHDIEYRLDTLRTLPGFIYLGSPYSLYKEGFHMAARRASTAAARLMAMGMVVYAPIPHGHTIASHGDLPNDWEFWKKQCQPFIDAASALVVLKLDGWRDSVGLNYEIDEFERAGKPIVYVAPEELRAADRRAA